MQLMSCLMHQEHCEQPLWAICRVSQQLAIFRKMQDLLRLIEIEGVDINPCGGTHLSCTSELQVLKIVGLEKSRGQARLRFMVGGRVLAALGSALKREVALNKVDLLHSMKVLAGLLSCLPLHLAQKCRLGPGEFVH